MKKLFVVWVMLLFASVAMFGFGQVTLAQETNKWTGSHIGLDTGYGFGKWNAPYYTSGSNQGILGGVEAGYNWEHRNIIFGFVGDFSLADVSGSKTYSEGFSDGGDGYSWSNKSTLTRLGTIRGRLGYELFDRFFVYGTAGVARAQAEMKWESSYVSLSQKPVPRPPEGTQVRSATGWVWGLGVEHTITSKWRVKAEIFRLQMEDEDYTNAIDPFTVVRFGVNYRL